MQHQWTRTAVMAAAMCVAGVSAYAQTSDADWLAQCRNQGDRGTRYCEVRPVNLGWSGSLRVDAKPNGGVQVKGSDQAGAVAGSARIQVRADTEAAARAIASGIQIDTSSGALRATGPVTGERESWSVSYVLSAPRRGDVQIDTVNGPVSVEGMAGLIRLTTVNGPLSLRELAGDVQARAKNGPVSVVLAGSSWEGNGLDVQVENGPVSLTVPEGYSAQLDAKTTNGPLSVSIPINGQNEKPNRRTKAVSGTIGSGGSPIRVQTTNGPLAVKSGR